MSGVGGIGFVCVRPPLWGFPPDAGAGYDSLSMGLPLPVTLKRVMSVGWEHPLPTPKEHLQASLQQAGWGSGFHGNQDPSLQMPLGSRKWAFSLPPANQDASKP